MNSISCNPPIYKGITGIESRYNVMAHARAILMNSLEFLDHLLWKTWVLIVVGYVSVYTLRFCLDIWQAL